MVVLGAGVVVLSFGDVNKGVGLISGLGAAAFPVFRSCRLVSWVCFVVFIKVYCVVLLCCVVC